MKILAIDDEKDTLAFMRDLLTQAGHQVATASSAVSGLLLARVDPPDLVFLDIMMPGIDGHQLAQSLAGSWDTFDIPIVILSCRSDRESKAWAKLNGCVRYLEKPASPSEILKVVREVERERENKPPGDWKRTSCPHPWE
ncbi:MAG: response regulator [Planctomycetes bacterium]|nr:response regulator [Planctomycetota bacterium]